jgi:hypothetical protein
MNRAFSAGLCACWGVAPGLYESHAIGAKHAGAEAFRVGGVADHVHLVTTLPRTLSQSDMKG